MKALRDSGVVYAREMVPVLRSPIAIIVTMAQPLVFLLLYGPLLSNIPGVEGGTPWQWFVPGIIVMLAMFGTMSAGFTLLAEIRSGVHERLLATPLARSALVTGRTLKDVTTLIVQALVIVVLTIPFGFRPDPLGLLAGLALLVVLGVGLGALSYALALAVKRQDGIFWAITQLLLFPLLLLSGTLLPMSLAPSWLDALSSANPLRYIVDAERVLMDGAFTDASVATGPAAALAIAAIGLFLSVRSMRRTAV
ncbi:ABC transporter permease [Actinomadura sp. KC06]|uniref:ABC transporter permease n=1 Tax=Actinomadura sp. KC06 TaxID=2530369 RepID=UPI001045CD13|nr:ABC transporter permease [Actinomadura sp. KC06]TDD37571.1 ABC transporter permease [Actinomadura sp. KC06]